MRASYSRSETYLDQVRQPDPALKQKQMIRNGIDDATPEQLDCVLEMLGIGKTSSQAR